LGYVSIDDAAPSSRLSMFAPATTLAATFELVLTLRLAPSSP
jgi:hypothetical protein